MNKKSKYIFAAITIIPSVTLVAIFLIYPAIKMFYQSFFNVTSLMKNPKYIGLDNYSYMFHKDDSFIVALKNTLFLMIIIPIIVPAISVVLSVLVTQSRLREKSFYRVLLFFPSIIQMVTIGILFTFVFSPNIGVVNSALNAIGLHSWAKPWLGDEKYAMFAVVLVLIWQSAGYYMVMDIAGIDRIPKELYESAEIDGANPVRKFIAITLPFLWEVVRMTIVFAIGAAVSTSFIITQVMTDGGPGLSTTTLLKYMYSQAFSNSNLGYGMSIAVVMLVLSLIFALISNKVTSKETLEF